MDEVVRELWGYSTHDRRDDQEEGLWDTIQLFVQSFGLDVGLGVKT